MGATNKTTNLELPQFIGTDKPSWLGDFNGAMNTIDVFAGTTTGSIGTVTGTANAAKATADSAAADVAALGTTVAQHTTEISDTMADVSALEADVTQINQKINTLSPLTDTLLYYPNYPGTVYAAVQTSYIGTSLCRTLFSPAYQGYLPNVNQNTSVVIGYVNGNPFNCTQIANTLNQGLNNNVPVQVCAPIVLKSYATIAICNFYMTYASQENVTYFIAYSPNNELTNGYFNFASPLYIIKGISTTSSVYLNAKPN